MRRLLFLMLGLLALGTGLIGVVVPGLPTTPLLLLAAFCFAHSSSHLEHWLKASRFYRKFAQDFVETKSLSKKQKIRILLISDCFMLLSIVFVSIWWVRLLILLAALIQLYVFVFKIPTKAD